jgi:polyadenylate-binding protein 2
MGNPKGFAYIEFLEADAVTNACLLDGSELRNRAIKVSPKRTNVPGMKAGRGGGRGRGRGGRGGGFYGGYGMMPMMPPMMFGYGYPPYGGGGRGRGRGRGGFQPY